MKRKNVVFLALSLILLLITGCKDRTELNDLAIELGWGLDAAKNNNVQISAQVVIPSKLQMGQGGGGGKGGNTYFVVSGTGTNTLDAVQKMQEKMSRRVFRGQRRVIVVGEQMARHGLADFLDTYSRDPQIRLRADMLVVKGGTAKEFLSTSYSLENIPALGALKEHEQLEDISDKTLLKFIGASAAEGSSPTLPVVEIIKGSSADEASDSAYFKMSGLAIFGQNLKLVGFLNSSEGKVVRWVSEDLKHLIVSGLMPNESGSVSVDLTKLDSKVKPILNANKIKVTITLTGIGMIRENNNKLDLTQLNNLKTVEKELDKQTKIRVMKTIQKVQREYGTDIFGFGEAIRRKNPIQWEKLKSRWQQELFSKADIEVNVKLTIRRVGLTGPSLHLKEEKVKK